MIGLPDSKHLELAGLKSRVTLTAWLEDMKLLIETHGFDNIYVIVGGKGHYLPEQWGDVTLPQVEDFFSELERTGDKVDKENLRLSGLACHESLGPDLFACMSSLISASTSGHVDLKIATDRMLFMNASTIRNLSNTLGCRDFDQSGLNSQWDGQLRGELVQEQSCQL